VTTPEAIFGEEMKGWVGVETIRNIFTNFLNS